MSVIPCAFNVAAVVSMMNSAMIFERPIPTIVWNCMRAICRGACWVAWISGLAWGSSFWSSTSSPACQKKR